jgi:hypothetical protein
MFQIRLHQNAAVMMPVELLELITAVNNHQVICQNQGHLHCSLYSHHQAMIIQILKNLQGYMQLVIQVMLALS